MEENFTETLFLLIYSNQISCYFKHKPSSNLPTSKTNAIFHI